MDEREQQSGTPDDLDVPTADAEQVTGGAQVATGDVNNDGAAVTGDGKLLGDVLAGASPRKRP